MLAFPPQCRGNDDTVSTTGNDPARRCLVGDAEFYAAEAEYVAAGGFGKADYETVAAYLDPDVVLYQAPGLPFTGTGAWRGHEGMERFLAAFSQTWESMEFVEQEHWGDEDTVIVRIRVRFRARATGCEVDTVIIQLIRVRGGRMLECHPFYWDPQAITTATQPHRPR